MKQLFAKHYKHVAFFIIIAIIGTYVINAIENDKREQYLQMQAELLQIKYDTNYKYLKIMSKDIYMMYSNNKVIVNIIKKAKDATPEKKAKLRKSLYDLLKKHYKRLKNMGIKQLHFHLPDNTSFLRMHKPDKFDDDLTLIRPSVVRTNKNEKFNEGFEVGKVAHGFRFVYPLHDDKNKHIGSFEVSFSSAQLLENILDSYMNDIHFLVSKEELINKTWEEHKETYYENSWESSKFMLEKATHKTAGDLNLYKKIDSSLVAKQIAKNMQTNIAFAISSINNYETIVLNFVPIKNLQNNSTVAYLVTYTESDYLDNVRLETFYLKILFYSILFLVFLFTIYVLSNREKLHHMAHYDDLTKLPNRSFFYIIFKNEINRASRHKDILALLFIDLDGFKSVNDTHGHKAGDELLIQVAQRLKNSIRSIDTVARLGGDEFTVILTNIKTKDEVLFIANKIIKNLNKDFIINQKAVNIGASIGVSLYPTHGKEIDILVQNADDMMYRAKGRGKNKTIMYKKLESAKKDD